METNKLNKVLIALDYDPTAQKIAETGFSLAKAIGSEVTLLHVITDASYYSALEYSPITGFLGFSEGDLSHLLEANGLKNATKNYLDRIKNRYGDSTVRTVVKEGDYAEAILMTAKESHAGIIIMGSHSRRWIDEILMGSVTEKVLHKTSIPLFIVPIRKHN